MKINGNEIRPGNVIQYNGNLWIAVKIQAVKPGKGGAFNQVEMRNLFNGSKANERFRANESVERVRLEQKDYQFLFDAGVAGVFGPGTKISLAAIEILNMLIKGYEA